MAEGIEAWNRNTIAGLGTETTPRTTNPDMTFTPRSLVHAIATSPFPIPLFNFDTHTTLPELRAPCTVHRRMLVGRTSGRAAECGDGN